MEKWKIPENPEKPGEYQWEALDDDAARKIILSALDEYIDLDSIRKVEELEENTTKKCVEILEDLPGSLSQ